MIAYIHSYTPNINHRQQSLSKNTITKKKHSGGSETGAEPYRDRGQDRVGGSTKSGRDPEKIRHRAICSFRSENTIFRLVERKECSGEIVCS